MLYLCWHCHISIDKVCCFKINLGFPLLRFTNALKINDYFFSLSHFSEINIHPVSYTRCIKLPANFPVSDERESDFGLVKFHCNLAEPLVRGARKWVYSGLVSARRRAEVLSRLCPRWYDSRRIYSDSISREGKSSPKAASFHQIKRMRRV